MFPVGHLQSITVPVYDQTHVQHVSCCLQGIFLAVLTNRDLCVLSVKPALVLARETRTDSCLQKHGSSTSCWWHSDSDKIVAVTSYGYLLFYDIYFRGNLSGSSVFNSRQAANKTIEHRHVSGAQNVVHCELRLTKVCEIPGHGISAVTNLKDCILVASRNSFVYRVSWTGKINHEKSFSITQLPYGFDLAQTKGVRLIDLDKLYAGTCAANKDSKLLSADTEQRIYVQSICHSGLFGGLACVFSNGAAAFIATIPSADGEDGYPKAVLPIEGFICTCAAVSHRYRLLALGCVDGSVAVYKLDSLTGALQLSHTLRVPASYCPDVSERTGAVQRMEWTPDGFGLAVAWQNEGLAIFSVFGALLFCTLDNETITPTIPEVESARTVPSSGFETDSLLKVIFPNFCWCIDGYQLWFTHLPAKSDNGSADKTKSVSLENLDMQDHKTSDASISKSSTFADLTLNGIASIYNVKLMYFSLAKTPMLNNPSMSNREYIVLQVDDRLYINTIDSVIRSTTMITKVCHQHQKSKTSQMSQATTQQGLDEVLIGRETDPESMVEMAQKMHKSQEQLQNGVLLMDTTYWQVLPLPASYLELNWPVRFCAIDRTGDLLCVAGRCGFIHCALANRKWHFFCNEAQERDMLVNGGMTWWKDLICVACHRISTGTEEVCFYWRQARLDNNYVSGRLMLSCPCFLLNTFCDILIVFTADGIATLYQISMDDSANSPEMNFLRLSGSLNRQMSALQRRNQSDSRQGQRGQRGLAINVTVTLTQIQRVDLNDHAVHPFTITYIALTPLRLDKLEPDQQRLFFKSPRSATGQILDPATVGIDVIAPFGEKQADSLLICVAGDVKLFQRDRTSSQPTLQPLPFAIPLMVATHVEQIWSMHKIESEKKQLNAALWLYCGAAGMKTWLPLSSDATSSGFHLSKRIMLPFEVDLYPLSVLIEEALLLGAHSDAHKAPNSCAGSFWRISRTSQICLHKILRELISRNAEVHALDIAKSCSELPQFSHCLEMLLHETLDAEATTKAAIPDPLLPRVVALLKQFPSHYLVTVVRCARKTELAHWPYLFQATGNPKQLFEKCLLMGDLDTAALYLIILQTVEKSLISRQLATVLLETALDREYWSLVRELIRFLKAIDPQEAMNPPPVSLVSPSPRVPPPVIKTLSGGVSSALPENAVSATEMGPDDEQRMRRTGSTRTRWSSSSPSDDDAYIERIVTRHARRLLSHYRLRDLGRLSANLDNYQLVSWLCREQNGAARVDSFSTAIEQLHEDFEWPYPICRTQCSSASMSIASRGNQETPSLISTDDFLVVTNSVALNNSNGSQQVGRVFTDNALKTHDIRLSRLTKDGLAMATEKQFDSTLGIRSNSMSEARDESVNLKGMREVGDEEKTRVWTGDELSLSSVASDATLPHLRQSGSYQPERGSAVAELQLRYLFQIMLEAQCYEWAVLLCIILGDLLGLVRTVNNAASSYRTLVAAEKLPQKHSASSASASAHLNARLSVSLSSHTVTPPSSASPLPPPSFSDPLSQVTQSSDALMQCFRRIHTGFADLVGWNQRLLGTSGYAAFLQSIEGPLATLSQLDTTAAIGSSATTLAVGTQKQPLSLEQKSVSTPTKSKTAASEVRGRADWRPGGGNGRGALSVPVGSAQRISALAASERSCGRGRRSVAPAGCTQTNANANANAAAAQLFGYEDPRSSSTDGTDHIVSPMHNPHSPGVASPTRNTYECSLQ